MIIQAIKVSTLIFFVYLSYITYFDYKESIQAQQTEQFMYNKQKLTKNNLWSQQQFKSINNNLHGLKFSVNYQTSLITLSLGSNRNEIVSFDDLDLQQQDVRQINSIQVIEKNDLVIKIQSQFFTLIYSISDKAICYERISFYANQQIFFVDHNKNLWIFTHPNNNMVLLRVYNRKRQQIMLSKYLPKNKIQLLIEFRPDENKKQVKLRFLTFSRNYLILTFNTENFSIKSEEQVQSHTFNYFQNEIKQFTIGLSQKILDIQTYNLIQRLIHKLTFGFMGKLIKDNNYTATTQQRFAASVIDPENAVVLEFNEFYNQTQLVSFGQVLIPMRTPVFINKDDQEKLITFDEALNRSRDNEEIPSVNFKLYGIKSKNLEILKGKGGIYRLLPDAKVHFMTFNRRLLQFYPKQNLNQQQYYIIRIPNGGIALKGSQIKGIFEQLPVYNKSATELKFGYSKDEVYHEMTTNGVQMGHSIYEAHAMHKGLFARSYKNRVQLITSLSGKSVLTHYLSTKNHYQYSNSYIENNQFWVFEHKQNSFPLITKYELFINSSSPRTILSIKRNYQINIVARITQVQKCIDYYYYFTYVSQDYKYGVARVHHALMSNRQARSDDKYAGQFQKMMVIPNMQKNDQFYVSSIEEDLLTAEFQVDPNVVKQWTKLELKHQYRVLPIRVYSHMNQYYIFDLRKIMVQAFNKQIVSAKRSFVYNTFLISSVALSIIILIIVLTSKRSEESIEEKPKGQEEQKNVSSKEKDKDKKKRSKQD